MDLQNNKIINSKCICGNGLGWKKYKQILLEPCEHIIHVKCLNKKYDNCPLCKKKIIGFYTKNNLKNLSTKSVDYYQKYVDMISVSNFDNLYDCGNELKFFDMIDIVSLISLIPFLSGHEDGKKGCDELLSLMNTKIVVNGMENITDKKNKIFISNHTSHIDFIILFYLFGCGFLSSAYIKKSWLGRQIMNIIPLLIIGRGKDKNTVNKMKNYIKNYNSLCLFPEGMITHPDTIIRFRTGAFFVGCPVVPITIRYEPIIYDTDINKLIKKISSGMHLTVFVNVLPIENPPFDTIKIENIRKNMGKTANLALSRVSNKDIKD